MKLFGSLAGLAAILSVVPYKIEKNESGEKTSYSLSSLTWKANYTPKTATEDSELNIDLLGGLVDVVDAVKTKLFEKEATPDFCETVVIENEPSEEASEAEAEEAAPEEEAEDIAESEEEPAAEETSEESVQ